jgi:hypothetical protein
MKLTGQLHTVATLSSPSGEVKQDTHLKRGWVGSRAGLHVVEKTKSLAPVGNRERFLGRPSRSLVPIPTELTQLQLYKK